MKTRTIRLLSILLTVAMLFGMVPAVYADETGSETDKTPVGSGTVYEVGDEKALRKALCNAPTDGTQITIRLTDDITLEMLYAAENFGTTKLLDNEAGDTFNRYKLGVHPTEDDPSHWNPLVTEQTEEVKKAYGAYYHTGASDERIARLVVKAGQNIVLDINGRNLKKDDRATAGEWGATHLNTIGNYGTLEIIDSECTGLISGNGFISCSPAVIQNYGGTLTIGMVMIDGGANNGTGQYVILNGEKDSSDYQNGTITLNGTQVFDNSTSATLVYNAAGTLNVNAANDGIDSPAVLRTGKSALKVMGGNVTLNGVEITAGKNAITVDGGAVDVRAAKMKGDGVVSVKSGATLTKADDVTLKAADGCVWKGNTLLATDAAVVVGDDGYYDSLAEAIAAAKDGDTVTLLKDVSESVTISGKQLTLELNGRTLTNKDGHTITVEAGAALTITGEGTVDNVTHAKGAIVNYGTVTLGGGIFTRSKEAGTFDPYGNGGNSWYVIANYGTMTITDGVTVTANGGYSSLICNGVENGFSKLTIDGGSFSGGINTVKNDENGELTINGGVFTNTTQHVVMNWNKATINGGAFSTELTNTAVLFSSAYGTSSGAAGELTITGGAFTAKVGQPLLRSVFSYTEGKDENKVTHTFHGKVEISGGAFNGDTAALAGVKACIEEGSEGKVTLSNLAVARIGDNDYASLSDAIAAAQDGDTITLLKDATLDNGVANEGSKARKVTIRGDGAQTVDVVARAFNAEGGMLNYQRGSEFTFENVKIKAGEGSFDGIVCDALTFTDCTLEGKLTLYGAATFTSCTFENTMADQYSIWTWGGTDVKFENCTFNTNGKAILLYGQATAEKPTNLVVSNTVFNDRNNGAAGKAAIEIGNDYGATYNLSVEKCTVNGFAAGKNTGSTLWANKNSMDVEHLEVVKDSEQLYGGEAMIGEKYYHTLAEAVKAAQDGDTVTLLRNVTLAERVVTRFSGTMDLNGKTLTSTDSCKNGSVFHVASGALTIKNGKMIGVPGPTGWTEELYKYECDAITVASGAVATLQDLTIEICSRTGACVYVFDGGLAYVRSGTYSNNTEEFDANGETKGMLLNQEDNKPQAIFVSGGTFKGENPANGDNSDAPATFLAAGCVSTETAEGSNVWTVSADPNKTFAAQTSLGNYETLAEAVAAAKSGDTVKLLTDVNEQTQIPAGKTITLDLNGRTMTYGDGGPTINNLGELTILDSSEGQNGKIVSNRDAAIRVGSDSKTTIEYANVESVEGAVVTGVSTGAKITINGGTFKASDNAVIAGNGTKRDGEPNRITVNGGTFTGNIKTSGYIACGIYAPWKDVITVNGGEFTVNNGIGIVVRAGQVTLTGGKFTCAGDAKGKVGDKAFDMEAAQCLYFDNSDPSYPAYAADSAISVSGGTFSGPVKEEYCAAGFIPTKNADGTYGVKPGSYVAQIGEVKYETLAEAIDAAKDGNTVTLLTDTNGDGVAVKSGRFPDKGLTIDFDGHTYTVGGLLVGSAGTGTNAFQLNAGNKITFKNGSVVGATEGSVSAADTHDWNGAPAIVIQNYCDLTLDNMVVSGGDETVYTMSNNCGNVVIRDSTINVGGAKVYPYGPVAFDVYGGFGEYSDVTVTVEGNSVINGKIEVARKSGTQNDNINSLIITGGTINGELSVESNEKTNVSVSGGTFSGPVKEEYCAAGYIPTANADGTYGVKPGSYVAQIGEVKYETLAEAVAAAKSGDTVKLLTDVELVEPAVVEGKTITLDLNGKKIFNTKEIWSDDDWSLVSVRKNGNLTITGNGALEAKDNDCYAVDVQDGSTLTIESGKFVGNIHAVYVLKGTATINGGDYSVQQKYPQGGKEDEFVLNCYDTNRAEGTAKIIVNGGTFAGFDPRHNQAEGASTNFTAEGVGIVKNEDGTYAARPDMAAQIVDSNGSSVEAYGTLAEAVAAVPDGGAIVLLKDSVGGGIGTYWLPGMDWNNNEKILAKGFTIDFAGHTYSVRTPAVGSDSYETQGFHFEWNGEGNIPNITLKNGTIDVADGHDANLKLLIQNYCNLTLDNMTLDGTRLEKPYGSGADKYTYVLSNNCGNVVIRDTTILAAEGSFAFDVYGGFKTYSDVTVTIEGGSVINGKIEVARKSGTQNDNINSLIITGGTINGELSVESNEKTNVSVSGGTFSGPVKEEYCAAGYIPTANADGTYGVKPGSYVAQIGEVKYETLAEAVAAAKSGDTVKLLTDATAEGPFLFLASGSTVDLNGKALTVEGKLLAFGKVIDSMDGEGQLIVGDMVGSQLPAENDYLPVMDGEGYRLYKYSFDHYDKGYNETDKGVMFAFQIRFETDSAWVKLANDDNSVKILYLAKWRDNEMNFRFKDTVLDGIAGQEPNEGRAYFMMTISGIDELGNGTEFSMKPQLVCDFFSQSLNPVTYTVGG